jgi:hypothetical protein
LQGIIESDKITRDFSPKSIIFVAPPFRHTHFDGKQRVIHNRTDAIHEIFSYNLYPGPSAKKGVYGALLTLGEEENWLTAHCSAVEVITPYDNNLTIMHEGASGGGKSEMIEHPHRELDGTLILGHNQDTGEKRMIVIPKECELRPACDDMANCHPSLQKTKEKLTITDAENAWFLRVNHIDEYGTEPFLEKLTVKPPKPLVFFNINAEPDSTALIWEHIEDAPGKNCPNPRVIVPRDIIPGIIEKEVVVDIRSFGIRTPFTNRQNQTYGIIGIFHVLPPALAWIWRLVSPRGFANPSIIDSDEISAEGVGSYWPFATGKKVDQANLLLNQMKETPNTQYVLVPNQFIGAWKVGFMPQWIMREYLARRGGFHFKKEQLAQSRCRLLGFSLNSMIVEGNTITEWFRKVETQPEVGIETYDIGAKILETFFKSELESFLTPSLDPLGSKIIECFFDNGNMEDYQALLEGIPIVSE